MSIELMMLIYSAALFLAIILAQAGLAIAQNGLANQAGSRDNLAEPTVLRQRMHRLTANMQENLVLFAIAVLAANAAGVSNETTVMGASIFFLCSRCACDCLCLWLADDSPAVLFCRFVRHRHHWLASCQCLIE